MPLIGKPRKVRFPNAQKPKNRTSTSTLLVPTKTTASTAMTTATDSNQPHPGIPALFTQPPPIRDPLITETIDLQNATLEKCLPFLKGIHSTQKDLNDYGVPALQRDIHTSYLYDALEDYPEGFVAMDASRPWIVYWALAGLAMLGEDTTRYRERVITTLRPMQNPTGGFGGGHGQTSHVAGSYAAVLSLAMVGGEEAFGLVDRNAMWQWIGRLKQTDGGFRVCEGGEEDVRGAYCAMTIISLLDLPLTLAPGSQAREAGLESLTSGLPEYLSRCQTFEGGISGSPGSEAHGAYAFCALACLSILGPPEEIFNRHMDIPMLVSWLSARQSAPEGGLSGRTNKLVDGCYSHWVGGCWPLLESSLEGKPDNTKPPTNSLFSREGLIRYILGCCQGTDGGLRDKPGKHVDSYHTCYVMAGLSATQNHHYRTASSVTSNNFSSSFSWKSSPNRDPGNVFSRGDRLEPMHPLYMIPHKAAEQMRLWSEAQPLTV
ncbi:uncharacterized protein N7479_006352 [Penicillium vulpinum]|uniref:Protein farnesyltransferase subunit beta n=1 Tax=Penicillium vulpinum TaxID=29845 RepID=A0A1V6RGQ3_9EURO|nr:uncharacterized protein N7479_006352 [Penicillium vulpinum]KAJ5959202.1 hypothetical protein N7479_006352 [Penicillium vulpinum]OQE00674.1 hypothetical protein PENVUL_c048G07233 [Penicillium vulpinum]